MPDPSRSLTPGPGASGPARAASPEARDALTATTATVYLDRLRHNARILKARAGEAELLAVVKANAYGHGAHAAVEALRAEGVRRFAVATVPEAVALREAGLADEIVVFAGPLPEFLPAYARYRLGVTVPSAEMAAVVARAARDAGPLRVHVKVDTGLSRLGIRPEELPDVVARLERASGVTIGSIWTHFATADAPDLAFAHAQFERFAAAVRPVADAAEHLHVANSAALLRLPELTAALGRALVRPGIALYGYTDLDGLAEASGLRPVMRFTSRVVQVKEIPAGATVSYGRRWTAPRATRLATVAAGYADGYHRLLGNRAEVGIGGRRFPVVGAVCMDMFMVDLGGAGDGRPASVGDEVVLFGDGGPSALEVARWAETIPYEVCTSVSARVPRRHVGAPEGRPEGAETPS